MDNLTYYHRTVIQLDEKLYPKKYLVRQIIRAKQYMDLHYAQFICLDTLANEASFSRFHFLRLFKSLYGNTPNQYLAAVRREKAKQLLSTSTESVEEIAQQLGFENLPYFTSWFKIQTGKPPAAFRKMKNSNIS